MKVARPRALLVAAEGAVTLGLVLLLFVAHQLWWTNRQAQEAAAREVAAASWPFPFKKLTLPPNHRGENMCGAAHQ
ncbi:hypothetical protein PV460_23200, partial [Streptomyces scabiei]|nr:hypothetical protein [Streptomyces scabiei]